MRAGKLAATVGTVLFLGAGVTQAVTVSPAVAAPAGAAQVSSFKDFQKGLSKGYRDGWRMARDECQKPYKAQYKLNSQETDYERGYERGFEKGFEKGFWEYCN
ncbi:hypothetical protein [Actinoplanes sp. GCM10030250]|uniref:hypothetical protein n=1 Tax=Actinoplanes sp. GCM10030250 TaxID=3273376 RepID=UPI00360A971D